MKKLALATTALIAMSSAANAVPQQGFPNWYIGLGAGVAGQTSSEFKTGGSKNKVDWDAGYAYKASIGYQPPSWGGFRVEAEYQNHHQDASGSGNNGRGGDVTANIGALNAYYDFFNQSVLTPYVGVGLGYGRFSASNDLTGTGGGNSDADVNRPIYQGILGVAWQPNSVPNVAFDLNYRYLAPFSELKSNGTRYDYDNHSLEAGARFKF